MILSVPTPSIRMYRLALPAIAGSIAFTLAGVDPAAASTAPARTSTPDDVPGTAVVRPGDTVTAIAARHGRRTRDVLAANGLATTSIIRPGQVLRLDPAEPQEAPAPIAAPPTPTRHTIVPGDTVTAIAARYGRSVSEILQANGLARDSIIYPGQTLDVGAPPPALPTATPVSAATTVELDAEQRANARRIVLIGRELGVPDRGIAIALGTAMQESWLRNLDIGDRDSGGLFQQRPSTGWGSDAEVRDADRAIRAFFGGTGDPNGTRTRGLRDITGWESMTFADAAQAVQISAYPDRYARWEAPATAWLAALS